MKEIKPDMAQNTKYNFYGEKARYSIDTRYVTKKFIMLKNAPYVTT